MANNTNALRYELIMNAVKVNHILHNKIKVNDSSFVETLVNDAL